MKGVLLSILAVVIRLIATVIMFGGFYIALIRGADLGAWALPFIPLGYAQATGIAVTMFVSLVLGMVLLQLTPSRKGRINPTALVALYYLIAIPLLFALIASISVLLWGYISLLWGIAGFVVSVLLAYAWLRVIKDLRGNKAIKQKPKAPANRQAVAPQALQAPQAQPIPPTMPLVQPDQAQMQSYVAQAFAQQPQQPLQQSQPAPIGETARLEQSLKDSAAALDDKGFEEWVAQMLAFLGWQNVQLVGGGRDRGVDIRGVFNGEKCIVQCKHYKGRLVPPNEVRALVGTLHIQKAKRGYLITSGRFGHQAFVEVHKKPVELWDLETFAAHIRNKQVG